MTKRIVSRLDTESTLKACTWHHYNDKPILGYLVTAYWDGMLSGQTDTGTVQQDEKKLLLMSHVQSNSALRTPA